jgi:hypothetical protein
LSGWCSEEHVVLSGDARVDAGELDNFVESFESKIFENGAMKLRRRLKLVFQEKYYVLGKGPGPDPNRGSQKSNRRARSQHLRGHCGIFEAEEHDGL